ncbi:carbonic anhydrase [Pedobacter westerhofensis]|uniref:Carbonic anhydrase n=1 Tax=Pedobacter westerhofensis TaxID=425512 RepID=A0A521FL80_9SPHI|nr:carbonic anhydrase family protein [Pedobacter westerhofensis]SMO96968.1 carbonic anhydrase [Pedobacter westerhofensis]
MKTLTNLSNLISFPRRSGTGLVRNSLLSAFITIILFSSCKQGGATVEHTADDRADSVEIAREDILNSDILTKDEQARLKPADVLARMKKGNIDFMKDNLTVRNTTSRVRKASLGQYPKAVVLSCLDSRVPVEDIFHSGIGNLFVVRVAGNIINEDILGSMEYACKVSGAKLVFVLGHEYCGAIKSAIDGFQLGNITALLRKIQPAVLSSKASFSGKALSSNPAFVEEVCDENVKLSIEAIRRRSSVLKEMESKGEIMIVGGVYDMNSGKVEIRELGL